MVPLLVAVPRKRAAFTGRCLQGLKGGQSGFLELLELILHRKAWKLTGDHVIGSC